MRSDPIRHCSQLSRRGEKILIALLEHPLIGALIVVTLELSLGHDKKSVPGRYLTQSGFLFWLCRAG